MLDNEQNFQSPELETAKRKESINKATREMSNDAKHSLLMYKEKKGDYHVLEETSVRMTYGVDAVANQLREKASSLTEPLTETVIPLDLNDRDVTQWGYTTSLPNWISRSMEKLSVAKRPGEVVDPDRAKRHIISTKNGGTKEIIPSRVPDMFLVITQEPNGKPQLEMVGNTLIHAELLAANYDEVVVEPKQEEKPVEHAMSIEDEAKAQADILMALRHQEDEEAPEPPDPTRNREAYNMWYTAVDGKKKARMHEYITLKTKLVQEIKARRERK